MAQLDNAADSDSEERGFESLRAGHVGAKSALLRLIFCLRQKISHSFSPLLLLFAKIPLGPPARPKTPFMTARCRYQLFAIQESSTPAAEMPKISFSCGLDTSERVKLVPIFCNKKSVTRSTVPPFRKKSRYACVARL